MRRRPDVIDRLLEEWASWRVIYRNLDFGTGNCSIVRFREPAATTGAGSMPLWYGRQTGRKLLAVDHDLNEDLGRTCVAILVTLYGMAGPMNKKAHAMDATVHQLRKLRRRARVIALRHVSKNLSAEVVHRDRFRYRSEKPADAARPLRPVSESDKSRT